MSDLACASTSSGNIYCNFIQRNGGTVLLHAGHEYTIKRKHKSGLNVWECIARKKRKCRGVIKVRSNNIVESKPHQCPPNFAKSEIDKRIQGLKHELASPDIPPVTQTYNTMVSEFKDSGLDLIEKIPGLKSIKSSLYRWRNESTGVSRMRFKNVEEVELPVKFKQFLLADYMHDGNRIIVFSIKEAREIIPQIQDFFSDGTFKSCPKPFIQIYTVHGDLKSSQNVTNIIPLIYAFMTRRDAKSYEILFDLIKSQIPDWEPKKYKTNFEKAAMKSIKSVFPSVQVKGCYTHFKKKIWDKGRDLNLTSSIEKTREVALTAALPLLPENEVNNGWLYITRKWTTDSDIRKFRKYVEDTWLTDNYIPVWNVFGEQHRTTNVVEGWHHKLNNAMGQTNPSFIKALHVLRKDASFYVVRRLQVEANTENSKKKRQKKAVINDMFIQDTQMELLHKEITTGHFLEIVRQ